MIPDALYDQSGVSGLYAAAAGTRPPDRKSVQRALCESISVFRFGINFNIPLFGDKTASAQLGKAKVEAERLDVQREQIEQGIQVEVRNAAPGDPNRRGSSAVPAAIARENTQKQYESEQRKLDDGQSDIYKVLERQTALSFARSNELRARTELNKAIADLNRATGNTLKVNDVETKRNEIRLHNRIRRASRTSRYATFRIPASQKPVRSSSALGGGIKSGRPSSSQRPISAATRLCPGTARDGIRGRGRIGR